MAKKDKSTSDNSEKANKPQSKKSSKISEHDQVHLYLCEETRFPIRNKDGVEGKEFLEALVQSVNKDGSANLVVSFSNGKLLSFDNVLPEGADIEGKDFYRTVAE
ncbi:MAG: hypothetical protein IT212_07670 [Bacteroidia bacterium]|nr:hypothetical protein [Bacteroidia bacterium]